MKGDIPEFHFAAELSGIRGRWRILQVRSFQNDFAEPLKCGGRLLKLFRTAEGCYPTRRAPMDCLPRSLALTRFLRTAGFPAEHVMGVALYPFEAHAWVELAGSALNEGATFLTRFTVIQRA